MSDGRVTVTRMHPQLPFGAEPSPLLTTAAPVVSSPAGVEVRRSSRRRRTVSAYRDGDRIIVLVPARFSRAEEQRWVDQMVARITARETRGSTRRSDATLLRRSRELVGEYLDGREYPASVRWVSNMRTRWASCTPTDRTIRVSDRLVSMPSWVLDYVLVHELAHLRVAAHSPRFWALVERYPRTERARGFLDGVSAAAGLAIEPDFEDDLEPDSDGPRRSGTDGLRGSDE